MAKNEVTLTFAGDTDKLERAFDQVGVAAKGMDDDVRQAGRGLDDLGDKAGDLDTRAMGFRDGITGVQDTMSGWSQLMKGDVAGGLLTLGMGVGDLASSVENLVVPLIKSGAQAIKTKVIWVAEHAKMAAATVVNATKIAATWAVNSAKAAASVVVSVARQVAAWVLLGVQSMIHAAKVAAAWLISMGPIALVIAAVIGLVYLIIRNWDTIKRVISAGWEFVKRVSSAVWNWLKSFVGGIIGAVVSRVRTDINTMVSLFRSLTGKLRTALSGVKEAFLAPFRAAFNGIKSLWNSTIGGKGVNIPGFGPFGGLKFTIPRLAKGGLVLPSPGGTIANISEAGKAEAVIPLDRLERMVAGGGGGRTVVELRSGGTALDDMLVEVIRKAINNRGGNVQAVLGG